MYHDPLFLDTYRYAMTDLRMDVPTLLGCAQKQRHFGPGRLLVLTATRSGRMLSLSNCELDGCPDCVLAACLEVLEEEQPALVAAIGDIGSGCLEDCPRCRFEAAYNQAEEIGAQLFDWIDCDETRIRSLRLACGGRYGDLPELIRPRRWTPDAVIPTDVSMPDVFDDAVGDPAWSAPVSRRA